MIRKSSFVTFFLVFFLCASVWGGDYEEGRKLFKKKDYLGAFTKWRDAADKGHVKSMNNLGVILENRQGVKKNPSEAARWYRKAADKGDSEGMYNLGVLFNRGLGVKLDFAEAARWYRKAADKGHVPVMCDLGVLYTNGLGVKKDLAEAARWYRKAADKGYARAKVALKRLGIKPSSK